jgi:hypothetical protein
MGYYAASSGNFSRMFQDILSVPTTGIKELISYRHFGKTFRSHLQGCPFKKGPISCPETSVINYHSSLRNNSAQLLMFKFIVMEITSLMIELIGDFLKYIRDYACFIIANAGLVCIKFDTINFYFLLHFIRRDEKLTLLIPPRNAA